MSGPGPMSPSTEPGTAVATGNASSAPAGLVSGHLDTGTTPVFSMSGPQGPPIVHAPVQPDPLQGAGDPWVSFHGVGGRSDGSFLSSGTYQTGHSTGQSSGPSGAPSTPATGVTFGMPPGFLDAPGGPVGGPGVPVMQDPMLMQVLRQQMLLTQSMVDFLSRTAQGAGAVPPLPGAQGQGPQAQVQGSQGQGSERLTMDTKWIPAAPMPDWKAWNTRSKELSGFKTWLDKFASWLCLVHDGYAAELREALNLQYPVVIVNQDQAIRSRRLFHLLQQSFSGYSRVDNVVKSQIAFYGIQEANGFELLRLLRREFSLMSRPEALQYREACLKYTVKKSERHALMDVLREIGAEIEGFHSMLEASLIAGQLGDLRINEGDQYLLYLRNLPEKVAEYVQLHCGATTVARVWESVVAYHTRMRLTNDLDSKVHVATGPKQGSEGVTCHNCGKKGHYARDCPQPVKCSHCGKSGHAAKDCWAKDPSKKPGASSTPKPSAKPKAKPAAKSKGGKGRGRGRGKGGKFREVEEGEEPCEAEESQEPEGEQEGGNQAAMVVKSFAVKTGSDAGGPRGATGTSSTERPVMHHLSSTLQEYVGSVGIGDPKTCWLVDSGATCHIVSEKWVKHYTVSFVYPGPSPCLKGAGDNDLPVKGVVDLEFKVGKTKITMKRVVVVGIPLNVISTYALLETGWKTVLGNAEESGLFLKKLKLPLKISERAWWLKVSLLSKHQSGVKGSGPAPMDLSTMNTGNTVNTDSTETKQTKRNTCCGCSSVAAVVPEDVVTKDLVTKGTKDSLTKDPVNHVATQEVAQVTKGRSGGSAKVKVKRRELQMKSADMLQSFSYVCRMFHFGSSHLFQHVFDEFEPNTNETDVCLEHNVANLQTNVETNDETTDIECDYMSCCASVADSDEDYVSCCDFGEFCQENHGTSLHMDWKYHEGRTGSGQSDRQCRCDWTFVDPCFRMMRGFPQMEDLTQDDVDDSDVMGDRPQAGEVSEVGSPSLANSEDLEGWGPHEPGLPERPDTPDGPEGSDLECSVPELGDGRLRMEHECRGHWPYDRGCDDCVQSRGRTPARRVGHKHETPHSLAADFLFVAGKHWKVLILLMVHTGMVGMVVCGGDKERDVQSTAAVLNEIGVGGLSVEVATDNEAALKSLVERGLAASSARGYHWRNISEARPQAKGIERAVCIMKEGIYANWLALERHCNARIALESPLLGYLVGHVYRTYNAYCEGKAGSTPLERLREKRGGQAPRSYPFGSVGFLKPIHPSKWPGQRLVLCHFLGMRYVTGGGCLGYPFSVDAEGYREVIKGHSFKLKEPLQYDVESLFPLLAGVRPQDFPEPRLEAPEAEQALPPPDFPPELDPPVLPREEVSPQPIADGAEGMDVDAGEVGEGPEPMTIDKVDEVSEGEGSEEEEGDAWLNNLILQTQADVWNTFCLRESGCVFPVGEGNGDFFVEEFGGQKVRVDIPERSFDELTGAALDFEQVKQGMKTEVQQLERLKVGRCLVEREGRALAKEKQVTVLTSRWVLTQKTPEIARCRLVVRDFATGGASALNSGIYAPTSSLDGLRCVLAVSVVKDLSLLTADVSVAFMHAPVEAEACDLVLLPANISINGCRVIAWLGKAMNGLRRAPLLWFLELQRVVYSMGGQDTFENTLFRLQTPNGLLLVLVYVDDLLVAAESPAEGEAFLQKLQNIWRIKLTGRIPALKRGVLQFLGRTIYRERDGESTLSLGVSEAYMAGIIDSWHEKLKPNETPPKLEEIYKDREKQGEDTPLTAEGEARYRRVLGQLAWAALSRADLCFSLSYLARFQSKPSGAAEACLRALLRWLLTRLHRVQIMPSPEGSPSVGPRSVVGFCDASWNVASVSGGVLMFEGCCIKVFSRKQECPALSSAEAELCAMTENSKELVSLGMLLESILDGIPLTILGTPQCTTGTYQLILRNDATAAISISSMEGLLRRVRHIELRAKYIQMLVKKKRLLLEHIPGLQNPSDGLTKSFKFREMLINLEKEVGLVPGLDTNGLSWIRTFQRRLQLLAEEGEMSSLLDGSVAPEF